MLWEDREIASVLCNIDEENKSYTYMSWWFNVCRTGLEIFEKILNS